MIPAAPSKSFRTRIAFTFGSLVVALAALLSLVFAFLMARQTESNTAQALHVVTRDVAVTLANGLAQRRTAIEALADSAVLWSGGLESPQVHEALERTKKSALHAAWIGVADSRGQVRASTGHLLEGASVLERPWFKAGLGGLYVGDVHKALLLAKLLPPGARNEPLRFVDFSAPLVVDGVTVGVVGEHGSWEWAREVVETLLPPDAARRGLELFIFDRTGRALYVPDGLKLDDFTAPAEALARRDAPAVTTWQDGQGYVTAAYALQPLQGVDDLGWTIVAREPADRAYAQARRLAWAVLGLGLAAAALATLFAWRRSNHLARPLADIARAALDVERGVEGAAIPACRGSLEMEQLSDALAGMTQRLIDGRRRLEAAVEARTAELRAANEQLVQLASRDPLTGLLNRRAFDERLGLALAQAQRSGTKPTSMLMIDADHFKRINDRYGHEQGDAVLKALATMLDSRLRVTDAVGRIGGEEFAVVLPDTDTSGALHLAQQLVAAAAALRLPGIEPFTVSVGVATAPPGADAGARLRREADQALYAAKHGGRNQAQPYREDALVV